MSQDGIPECGIGQSRDHSYLHGGHNLPRDYTESSEAEDVAVLQTDKADVAPVQLSCLGRPDLLAQRGATSSGVGVGIRLICWE